MIFLICDVIVRSNSIMFSLDMYPFFKNGGVLIGKTGTVLQVVKAPFLPLTQIIHKLFLVAVTRELLSVGIEIHA